MKRQTSIFFLLGWNDYRIFQGISRYANQAGWQMDTRHFFRNLFPMDRSFRGMIAMYHSDPAVRAYIRKKAKSVPTVILGTQSAGFRAPQVMPNDRQAGQMAAEHLSELFHKNYGWFACDVDPSGKTRKASFEKKVRKLGFSCLDLSCGGKPFNEKTVLHKLKECPKPIGIMARDDHDASVLISLCQQAELHIPEEVSIVGVGDLESLCAFSPVPISSISLNMEELGFQSAAVLDKMMQGRSVPPRTIIPAGPLHRRFSTDCFALTDPHLKKAIQIIDTRYPEPLTAHTIALASGISRRQLYKLFRSEMHCAPYHYLLTVRLNHARDLIRNNVLNFSKIAKACGLNNRRTLNRAFTRTFGISPSRADL